MSWGLQPPLFQHIRAKFAENDIVRVHRQIYDWCRHLYREFLGLAEAVEATYCTVHFASGVALAPINTPISMTLILEHIDGMVFSSSGITVVTPGKYKISGSALIFNAGGGSYTSVNVYRNGATISANVGAANSWNPFPVDVVADFAAGDVITFTAQSDGTASTDPRHSVTVQKISTNDTILPGTVSTAELDVRLARSGASKESATASFPNAAFTQISWGSTLADTHGFVTSGPVFTIPPGKDGLYIAAVTLGFSSTTSGCYLAVFMGSNRYDWAGPGNGSLVASQARLMTAGEQVSFNVWNGSGVALSTVSSRVDLYRVSP